jgi:hypothetical protein
MEVRVREMLPGTSRSIPVLSRFGTVVMTFGLLLDSVEHGLVGHAAEPRLGQFPLSEHAAHFVVFIGMVLVLAGVINDGLRQQLTQNKGKENHALR